VGAPAIEVAAGLVFRRGRLLIAQRAQGDHLGGLWEFPGGKRETGESFEECLRRELLEELGIHVTVGRLIWQVTHEYPDKAVDLRFYLCRWCHHEPQAIGCQAFAWVGKDELRGFAFPPADAGLIGRLMVDRELWAAE
jgi:mutator protein MutT